MVAPTVFFADYGSPIRILGEIRSLQRLGHEVMVCTYKAGVDPEGVVTKRVRFGPTRQKPGFTFHRLHLDMQLMGLSATAGFRWKPDIIHAHLHEGVAVSVFARLANRGRQPIVLDAQGSFVDETVGRLARRNRRLISIASWLEGMAYRKADQIITSSHGLTNRIPKEYCIQPSKVHTLLDGVDTTHFNSNLRFDATVTNQVRSWLDIPKDAPIVTFLGLLSELQGIDLLVKAVPEVVKVFPNVHFVIGGYPDQEVYDTLAKDLGVSNNMRFAGKVDYVKQAPQLLAASTIAVAPKRPSNQSNGKVLSYMSMGLPTVVFEDEVNRYLLGDVGLYAKELSSASLAQVIVEALSDQSSRQRLAEAGIKRVYDHFTWDHIGRNLVHVYELALQHGARR